MIDASSVIDAILAERLRAVARRRATPFYAVDLATLDASCAAVRDAFPDPVVRQYSVKANDEPAVIRAVCGRGFGANVVSRGEWTAARRAGVPNDRISLEGVGKSTADLRAAVRAAVTGHPLRWVALESPEEADDLASMARRAGVTIDVLYRLNPDVTPETLAFLAVGTGASKFGMDEPGIAAAIAVGGGSAGPLRPRGLHLHVGSQLGAVDAWREAVRRALALAALWRGSIATFDTVDLGGGFPVAPAGEPAPTPGRFARELPALLEAIPADRRPARLVVEPGRALVARAGWLVARVLHARERGGRQVVIDAGMTELIRPALYGAWHPVVALTSEGRPSAGTTVRRPRNGRSTSRRPASKVRSASRRTTWAATSCRRCGGATSWPSLTRGRMRARSGPATTAARTYPMSSCPNMRDDGRRVAQNRRAMPPATMSSFRARGARGSRASLGALAALGAAWLVVLSLLLPALAVAADASAPPPGPPFPEPIEGQAVYDEAGLFQSTTRQQAELIVDAIEAQTGAEVVVYTQALGRDGITAAETEAHARALMDEWGIGRAGVDDGLVILFDLDTTGRHGQAQLFAGPGFSATYLSDAQRQAIFDDTMAPLLRDGKFDEALLATLGQVVSATFEATPPAGASSPPTETRPPGPPYPDPVTDRAVYDNAGILTPGAIVGAESTIDAIEARTGAEVVVYTEHADYGVTTEETEARARALIDQWGIGRKGFDDGMVIFFDIDPSGQHGQVQLYAAPGFEATYLTNQQRQSIYENDMLPYLKAADFDGALKVAMQRIDAAATPENAARLQTGRQVNAVIGLLGAPIIFLGLLGWGVFDWRRYGKDPVYLDDPSILMPAPPPDLTAASGAAVMDGGSSRRALTTAMLDLASRGLISFRQETSGLLGHTHKIGIETEPGHGDDVEEANRRLNARRPTGPAEAVALRRLRAIDSSDGYIEPDDMLKFGSAVGEFDSALEAHVVDKGWMADKPSTVRRRWQARGWIAGGLGAVGLWLGFQLPSSGLLLLGGAAIGGGVALLVLARWMPSVTMAGATIRAMLAAYRRTLEKTMEQARSMQQVVDEAKLDWLETPDQAVVWGTALGLQSQIEAVLERSMEDVKAGQASASTAWFPAWYHTSSGGTPFSAGSGGSIFSGSAVPDVGGMMAALGTIGNSPSSSGGGGFGGGGGGGGGGGAGGGF